MFNERERLALLFLGGALLLGSVLSLADNMIPATLDDFSVAVETVAVPQALPVVESGPLDVNTATVQQLQVLPGIGPAMASRIVADRQQQGPFVSLAALKRVRGIGPRTVERLAGLAVVATPARRK